MAEPKDSQKEIEIALSELEERVDRLRSLYEQYFMGYEKIVPGVQRKDVDRRFALLRKAQIRNTALRFRFNVVTQKFNTYAMYWTRVCRQIEEGTFKRHLVKAQQRFGETTAKRRAEGEAIDIEIGEFELDESELNAVLDDANARDTRAGAPPPLETSNVAGQARETIVEPPGMGAHKAAPRAARSAALPPGARPRVLVRRRDGEAAPPAEGSTPDLGQPPAGAPNVRPPMRSTPDLGQPPAGAPNVRPPMRSTPDLGQSPAGAPNVRPPMRSTPDLGQPPPSAPNVRPPMRSTPDLGQPPPSAPNVRPPMRSTPDLGQPPPSAPNVRPPIGSTPDLGRPLPPPIRSPHAPNAAPSVRRIAVPPSGEASPSPVPAAQTSPTAGPVPELPAPPANARTATRPAGSPRAPGIRPIPNATPRTPFAPIRPVAPTPPANSAHESDEPRSSRRSPPLPSQLGNKKNP